MNFPYFPHFLALLLILSGLNISLQVTNRFLVVTEGQTLLTVYIFTIHTRHFSRCVWFTVFPQLWMQQFKCSQLLVNPHGETTVKWCITAHHTVDNKAWSVSRICFIFQNQNKKNNFMFVLDVVWWIIKENLAIRFPFHLRFNDSLQLFFFYIYIHRSAWRFSTISCFPKVGMKGWQPYFIILLFNWPFTKSIAIKLFMKRESPINIIDCSCIKLMEL